MARVGGGPRRGCVRCPKSGASPRDSRAPLPRRRAPEAAAGAPRPRPPSLEHSRGAPVSGAEDFGPGCSQSTALRTPAPQPRRRGQSGFPGFLEKWGQAHRVPILPLPHPSPCKLSRGFGKLGPRSPSSAPGLRLLGQQRECRGPRGVTPAAERQLRASRWGPRGHDPQAVPPTAAGLEPAAPRALLAAARSRGGGGKSSVETEEKLGPQVLCRRSRKLEVWGPVVRVLHLQPLPRSSRRQGGAWECNDAGGHKAPRSRPTWAPLWPPAHRRPTPRQPRSPLLPLPAPCGEKTREPRQTCP